MNTSKISLGEYDGSIPEVSCCAASDIVLADRPLGNTIESRHGSLKPSLRDL